MKEKWQGIKKCKAKYVTNFNKQLDIRGNRIPHGKRAEATAEYLSQVQWKNTNDTPAKINPEKIINDNLNIEDGRITINEII